MASVQTAKTARPRLPRVVRRTRLFRQLDGGWHLPLTWISGPAGYGKTTLMASYLEYKSLPCLWYQIDAGDRDPGRFFHYLDAAAHALAPQSGPLPAFGPEYESDLARFAHRYFRTLFSYLPRPVALVFDNYENLPLNEPLHGLLAAGLQEVPPDVKVFILSRQEMPSPFVPLLAKGMVEQIHRESLRLHTDEAAAIAELRAQHAAHDGEAIARLNRRVEGWAAGLILLLAQPQTPRAGVGEEDPARLFDYFGRELLDSVEPRLRDFLLRTAFLPCFSVHMAEAFSGDEEADRRLTELSRANFFIYHHSDTGEFQYHNLFRRFLLSEAHQRLGNDTFSQLQRRAARVLADCGYIDEAIEVAAQSGDSEYSLQLAVQGAPQLYAQGRLRTLHRWLDQIPAEQRSASPWAGYWLAMSLMPFAPSHAEALFGAAYTGFAGQSERKGMFLACAGALEAVVNGLDDFEKADPWIDRVQRLIGVDDSFPDIETEAAVTVGMLGTAIWHRPDSEHIGPWATRAAALWRILKAPGERIRLGQLLIQYHDWIRGDYPSAEPILVALRQLERETDMPPLALIALKLVESEYEWAMNDQGDGTDMLNHGLAIAQDTGIHVWDPMLLAGMVYAAMKRHDTEQAGVYLGQMTDMSLNQAPRIIQAHYHYLCAWRDIVVGEPAAAAGHLGHAFEELNGAAAAYPQALCRFAHSQVLFECDRPGEARSELDVAQTAARAMKCVSLEFGCQLLGAYYDYKTGNDGRAEVSLRQALALGRQHSLSVFHWYRKTVLTDLARTALEADIESDYVAQLIQKLRLQPAVPPIELEKWPWEIRIYTFGDFAILRAGQLLRFKGKAQKKPLELLKVLISFGGRDAADSWLAERLWPEAEGDSALQSLATTLHRLRKLIGTDNVWRQQGRVGLDPTRVWCDRWLLEHLLDELATRRLPPRALEASFSRIARLYRGPFLAGEEQSWALFARERIRDRLRWHLIDAADRLCGEHHIDEAIRIYHQGLAIDPLAEPAYRGLITCLLRKGEIAESLSIYRQCETALRDGLGVAPSPSTEALYRELQDLVESK